MTRDSATRKLQELLERVTAGGDYVDEVQTIYVFGSYARGALDVEDIDLDVEHSRSERYQELIGDRWWSHRDPHVDFNSALRGSRRGFQILYGQAEQLRDIDGFDLQPIYERGDSLDHAMQRLHAIQPDPSAGSYPRESVLPQMVGIEKLITRPERQLLSKLVEQGAVTLERIDLPERVPSSREARREVEFNLAERNPKRRAAYAAAAWLEKQGAREVFMGSTVAPMFDDSGDWCVYFGLGSVERAINALAYSEARTCLCVFNETRKTAPLHSLVLSGHGSSDFRRVIAEAERA